LNPDTFASFPEEGGEILKIIYQNLKLPNEIDSIPIGKIIVKMVITENGEITNVEVLYPPQELLAKEIIRVIQLMPNFIPAKVQGKNVASYFTMPIHINLTK